MRALWASDGASFSGEFVNFKDVSCNPKPVGRVPIIVGGHSEAAARRAGRLCDGFFPSVGAPFDTFPLFDVARRAAAAAGRDPGDDRDDGRLPRPPARLDAWSRRPPSRSASRRGVGRIVLPVGPFMPNLEESLARFGETVIKPFADLGLGEGLADARPVGDRLLPGRARAGW